MSLPHQCMALPASQDPCFQVHSVFMSLCLSLSYYCLYLFLCVFVHVFVFVFVSFWNWLQNCATLQDFDNFEDCWGTKQEEFCKDEASTYKTKIVDWKRLSESSIVPKDHKNCPGWRLGVLCTWGGVRGKGSLCFIYTSRWEIFVGKNTGCPKKVANRILGAMFGVQSFWDKWPKMAQIGQNSPRYPGWPKVVPTSPLSSVKTLVTCCYNNLLGLNN